MPSLVLGPTGLRVSPVGVARHRLGSLDSKKETLAASIELGCNRFDLAPNYTHGIADASSGEVLDDLLSEGEDRRDELIVVTKTGNVLGAQMQQAQGVPGTAKFNEDLWHYISPAWIEQELTRSLERLQLQCVDCL